MRGVGFKVGCRFGFIVPGSGGGLGEPGDPGEGSGPGLDSRGGVQTNQGGVS